MISVAVIGREEVRARLGALYPEARENVLHTVSKLTIDLQTKVRVEKLSGQILHNRTGLLRDSITQRVEDGGTVITGIVGADMGMAKYAAAQEYGATIHIPEIVPVNAKALHFMLKSGAEVFARRVRAHEVVLPERSYLRSSLAESESEIVSELTDAVGDAVRGA